MNALERAIQIAGGAASLAEKIGVVPMTISQWRKRGIPAKRAVEVELAVDGKVTRAELRPDLFAPTAGESTHSSKAS